MPPKLDQATKTTHVHMVAPQSLLARVEEWRRKQPQIPSKSEAIRILVEFALEAQEPSAPPATRPKRVSGKADRV